MNDEPIITSTEESFDQLAISLRTMNDAFQQSAASAINKHVTCRNWLNGYYIVHYEQNGSDRAKYGEKLLQKLAERLKMKGYSYRDLKLYRQFFIEFNQISPAIFDFLTHDFEIGQSLIAQLERTENQVDRIGQSLIVQSDSDSIQVPADRLFNCLSYTHFVQLLPIEDP